MTLSADAQRVVALLTERDRFPREDVEDLLAYLVLQLPPDQRNLDDAGATLLGRFAARAGIVGGASPDAMHTQIVQYFERKPLNDAIVDALSTLVRERALTDGGALENALGQFVGSKEARGVLGGGTRPEGTVPAGPMARFRVDKKR